MQGNTLNALSSKGEQFLFIIPGISNVDAVTELSSCQMPTNNSIVAPQLQVIKIQKTHSNQVLPLGQPNSAINSLPIVGIAENGNSLQMSDNENFMAPQLQFIKTEQTCSKQVSLVGQQKNDINSLPTIAVTENSNLCQRSGIENFEDSQLQFIKTEQICCEQVSPSGQPNITSNSLPIIGVAEHNYCQKSGNKNIVAPQLQFQKAEKTCSNQVLSIGPQNNTINSMPIIGISNSCQTSDNENFLTSQLLQFIKTKQTCSKQVPPVGPQNITINGLPIIEITENDNLCQTSENENFVASDLLQFIKTTVQQTCTKQIPPIEQQNITKDNLNLRIVRLAENVNRETLFTFRGSLADRQTVGDYLTKKDEFPDEVRKEIKYLRTMFVNNKCLICGFVSNSKRARIGLKDDYKHMMVHLTTKPYKCDICDKGFASSKNLQNHIVIHDDSFPFSCTVCSRRFRRNADAVKHWERVHANMGSASFTCSVCSRTFKRKSGLQRHYRTHTGEQVHLHYCTECNQGFAKSDSLKTHMNKHKGIRPYKCDECEKSFRNKRYLKHHKNLHSKAKSFECEVCHVTFNFKSNLTQHMKTHTQERVHECEVCGKTFKFPHHLRQHLPTHSGPGSRKQSS